MRNALFRPRPTTNPYYANTPMPDLFKDYKARTATRSKRRFAIIGISLALAIGVNMTLFGSDL
ncbi:MAG TPA: hypothetical protein PK765_07310 [bacterium]|nr:hypothetical protein [bacterium]